MNIKSFYKYKMPNIKANENVLFISFEFFDDDLFLRKIYLNKRLFYNLLNYLKSDFETKIIKKYPKLREVTQKIDRSRFLNILELYNIKVAFHPNEQNIDDLNVLLSKKIIFRTNVGFRVIDQEFINLLSENEKKVVNKFKINDKKMCNSDFIYKNPLKVKLKIYDVGQANCSSLYINDKLTIFFDLGSMKYNSILYKDFDNFMDGYVFISHFDNDHINAYNHFFLKKKKRNVKIIFPYEKSIYKLSFNAQIFLFCAYISNYELYPVILKENNLKIFNNDFITLYQGIYIKSSINKITKRNALSLICQIKHNKNSVLIPGDALYDNFPNYYDINHIIIPHHGCKYNCQKCFTNISENKILKSFVFCGPSKVYKHPNYDHLKHFYNDKKQVVYRFEYNKRKFKSGIFENDKEIKKEDDFTTLINKKYINWNL